MAVAEMVVAVALVVGVLVVGAAAVMMVVVMVTAGEEMVVPAVAVEEEVVTGEAAEVGELRPRSTSRTAPWSTSAICKAMHGGLEASLLTPWQPSHTASGTPRTLTNGTVVLASMAFKKS